MKDVTPQRRTLSSEAFAHGVVHWYDDDRSARLGSLIAEALDGRGERLRRLGNDPIEVLERGAESQLLRRFPARSTARLKRSN